MRSPRTSAAYSLESAWTAHYARRFARVLTGPEAVDIVTQATGSPYNLTQYGTKLQYVKQLTNPLNMKAGGGEGGGRNAGDGENTLVFTWMQTYYQGERAMPPVDKNVASPVQAMMMMTSPVVRKRVVGEGNTRGRAVVEVREIR